MQEGCLYQRADISQGKVFIKGTVPPCKEHICSLHGGLMRQPAKVLFLCAEMIYGTTDIPCVSAQWTHEAAHEGRPVSELPECMNGGPQGKDLTQGSCLCLGIDFGHWL